MKQILQRFSVRRLLSLMFLMAMVGNVWGVDVTGTIIFNKDNVKISKNSVTANDNQGNSWTITTVGTESFSTTSTAYQKVGKEGEKKTGITFTMRLPSDVTFKSISAQFGGFSGTTGTINLEVDGANVGTGSLNENTIIDAASTKTAFGKTLTVTVTNITNGVKCYNISYTYSIEQATISLNAACTDGEKVYGTYCNSLAWVVPENLTVSEIGTVDGKLNVQSYKTGDIVPANTGVMVSASTGGNYTVDLSSETGTSKLGEDNALQPTGNAGITAAQMSDTNYTYYRLTMHNGTQIGFYWGAADGAGFALGANKAYLAVPKSKSEGGTDEGEEALVKMSYWFTNDNETDGVVSINNEQLTINNGTFGNGRNVFMENGKIVIVKNGTKYNVAGQRVK